MLTRAAPAFNKATQGNLNPALSQALSQAMFNCAQPLEHRGPANFMSGAFPQRGGVLNANGWDPSAYPGLFPNVANQPFVEAPGPGGYHAGDWYSTFYAGPYFDLQTQLQQSLNQYYGGPNVTIEGAANIENLTTENTYTTNLEVDVINGEPAPGKDGADGPAGPQGARGLDGNPGIGGNIFNDIDVIVNNPPNLGLRARIVILEGQVNLLIQAVRKLNAQLRGLEIFGWPQDKPVVRNARFDEENCRVVQSKQRVTLRIRVPG